MPNKLPKIPPSRRGEEQAADAHRLLQSGRSGQGRPGRGAAERATQLEAAASTQKLTEAESQKKASEEALAGAKNQVAAATTANQAARKRLRKSST